MVVLVLVGCDGVAVVDGGGDAEVGGCACLVTWMVGVVGVVVLVLVLVVVVLLLLLSACLCVRLNPLPGTWHGLFFFLFPHGCTA